MVNGKLTVSKATSGKSTCSKLCAAVVSLMHLKLGIFPTAMQTHTERNGSLDRAYLSLCVCTAPSARKGGQSKVGPLSRYS